MNRVTNIGAAFAVSVLTLSLAAPAAQAGPVASVKGTAARSSTASPLLVQGLLRDQSGRGLPNVPLMLVAWPSQLVQGHLKIGEAVPLTNLSQAITNVAGSFSFPTDADALSSDPRVAKLGGVINLEVLSFDPNAGVVPLGFSIYRMQGSVAGAATVMTQASTDLSSLVMQVNPELAFHSPMHGNPPRFIGDLCTSTLSANLGTALSDVAAVDVATGGVTGAFTYSTGATSELGVGISASGAYGTFSASGTSGTSSTATQRFPTVPALTDQYEQTNFTWNKYHVTCYARGVLTANYYQANATGWAGGSAVAASSPPLTPYCVHELAGSGFTIEKNSTASTIVGGSLTRGILGVSLSAQTGYSASAAVGYNFALSGDLCGQNGYIGGTPGTLVARP